MTRDDLRKALALLYGSQPIAERARRLGLKPRTLLGMLNGTIHIWKGVETKINNLLGEQKRFGNPETRPILLGRNDYTATSAHQPWWPKAGLGHDMWMKLAERLGLSKTQYLNSFDRRCLTYVPFGYTDSAHLPRYMAQAKDNAPAMHLSLVGRTVILLDENAGPLLGLYRHNLKYLDWYEDDGITWCRVPRRPPMGAWVEPEVNRVVADRLVEVYLAWLSLPY